MTNPRRKTGRRGRKAVADVAGQLAALNEITIGQLKEKYREVFGEPTRSRNKPYLKKKIAWRIAEFISPELRAKSRERKDRLAQHASILLRSRPLVKVVQ